MDKKFNKKKIKKGLELNKVILTSVLILYIFNTIGCSKAVIKNDKYNLQNKNIKAEEINDLNNKITNIYYKRWLFNSQFLLEPLSYWLWFKNYGNYDITLLSFSWPIRSDLQYLLDSEYRNYENYVDFVPNLYLENNSFIPDLLLYGSVFINVIKYHDLTFNNIGDKSLTLLLGIPALLLGYHIRDSDGKISTTIDYLLGTTRLEGKKELTTEDIYYNNKYNYNYFKYKNTIPIISDNLINRANLYILLKDYLLPISVLSAGLYNFINQLTNKENKNCNFLIYTLFPLIPVTIIPFFDSEFNSYDKYKNIVPEIYNTGTGFNFFVLLLSMIVNSGFPQETFLNVDPVTLGFIGVLSFSVIFYFDFSQRETYKTIKYIYKIQEYEKKELLNGKN